MTSGLYDQIETDSSREALEELASLLPQPVVLLGGWAVFLTVNESYNQSVGRDYLGSKDVDLGFHIEPSWSLEELEASSYALALKAIEKCGYIPAGTSRYHKIIHKETRQILGEREASQVPIHNLFYLYLDPIVDIIHPEHARLFSIKPIDEPLLAKVFAEGHFETVQMSTSEIKIPDTSTLLATKLASFPNRDREHKRIKDACDIYSLLWHSPDDFRSLILNLREKYPLLCNSAKGLMKQDVSNVASIHLGIKKQTYQDVIRKIVK